MISVIVPIYNSEKYLERCISSIIAQSFSDIEILLIDDGSKDKTAEICKKYVISDNRVKYYRKENGGVASARNLGLSKAKGSYITFVDSDDYIGKNYLKKMAEQITDEKYTLIQCGLTLEKEDCRTQLSYEKMKCNQKEYVRMVISRQIPIFLFQTTVSKLYNRKVIVENKLLFNENVPISEDCLFNTQLMPFIDAYCYVDSNLYYYNQHNDNSLTHNRKRDFQSILSSIDVGIITSSIRNKCILENQLQNDSEICRGFQRAVCIIYLSNACEIEEAYFSYEQRKQLYEMYFKEMNYSIDDIIKEYSGTDKIILRANKNKNDRIIHIIYKLRHYKSKLLNCLKNRI